MIILLHSSKTMRVVPSDAGKKLRMPELIGKAAQLAAYLKTLPPATLAKVMAVSPALAGKTKQVIVGWNSDPADQSIALDSFIGDIYSGLQVRGLSSADRAYADRTLRILSGLYGVLRPLDGVRPYRLEMGYRLPDPAFANLYAFWGDAIARTLPPTGLIVNLAAVEYSKTVTPFVDASRIIAPKFLTADPKTGEPTFVTVHAKIARGAFARWLIQGRIDDRADIPKFADIGYHFDVGRSTLDVPVFVCQEFGGKGLSVRMQEG